MFGIELVLAEMTGRSRFYFSPFYFDRMRERGNTHYCFHCGGSVGFTPGPNGEATNCIEGKGKGASNPMERHDPATHADGVIGDVDQHTCPQNWLQKAKYPDGFPFIVKIQ